MELAPGTIVDGKFRILRKLGEGGMGVVLAADHLQLRTPVAIKLLKREASDKRLERFMREARSLAQLQTDHVTRVYDVGTLPSGEPYIVMELLEGEDLSSMGHRVGALPPTDVVDYIMQALVALTEAHAIGIVHRDIKPANLFLAVMRDGHRIVKVLDFGISKVNEQAKGRATALTATGAMLGSPYYMSPEQMKGTRDVDARADIWSLGATMHRLISGRYPFVAPSVAEIAIEILTKDPPPLRQLAPEVPVALEQIVKRCMTRAAEHRYQSVTELAVALAPLGSSESVRALERMRTGLAKRGKTLPPVTLAAEQTMAPTAETSVPSASPAASPAGVTATADDPSMSHPSHSSYGASHAASYASQPSGYGPQPGYPPAPHASHQGYAPSPVTPMVAPATGRSPRWPWAVAALLVIGGAAGGLAFALSGDEGSSGGKRSAASDDGAASSTESKGKSKEASKGKAVALKSSRPYYAQAAVIADAVRKAHGRPLKIYDVLLYEDRARFVVESEAGGLVRYEVEDGTIGEPKPHTLSSASRLDNLLLDRSTLDFAQVPRMAEDAPRRLGNPSAKAFSVSLHRVSQGVIWVVSLTTGESTHYNFAGQPVKR